MSRGGRLVGPALWTHAAVLGAAGIQSRVATGQREEPISSRNTSATSCGGADRLAQAVLAVGDLGAVVGIGAVAVVAQGPAVQGPAVQGPAVQGPAVQGPAVQAQAVQQAPDAAERVRCERVRCERVRCERVRCERVRCERVRCERVHRGANGAQTPAAGRRTRWLQPHLPLGFLAGWLAQPLTHRPLAGGLRLAIEGGSGASRRADGPSAPPAPPAPPARRRGSAPPRRRQA
jgi:hypothetical protein